MLLTRSPSSFRDSIKLSRPRTLFECARLFELPVIARSREPWLEPSSERPSTGVEAPEEYPGTWLLSEVLPEGSLAFALTPWLLEGDFPLWMESVLLSSRSFPVALLLTANKEKGQDHVRCFKSHTLECRALFSAWNIGTKSSSRTRSRRRNEGSN
jgi:hypothetical protein